MNIKSSIWQSEVRDYEIDYQGVVNNAHYFHYLDEARTQYLKQLGLNITQCAAENKNLVLLKTSIDFKKSLVSRNVFSVYSEIIRISRFKFKFEQKIFLEPEKQLVVFSESIVACVTRDGKPCILEELNELELSRPLEIKI